MEKRKSIDKKAIINAIYGIVQLIPEGRATSYGAIAKAIGYPNLSRLVGKVMSQCDCEKQGIPAHRVVNSRGVLSARNVFDNMQKLLEKEGIVIVDNKIKNWNIIFWNPLTEINI